MATVQGIYIALFGRPADPLGLDFYNGITNNGADLSNISGLTGSAEYQARFSGQSNVQIVNSIYQSLFARDADLAGLTFYVGELQAGRLTIEQIAIAIYDGATGTDAEVLANKEIAANQFTASLDTGAEIVAYNADAIPAAQAYLAAVTADDATIPTQAETDAVIAAIVDDAQSAPDAVFTLTASTTPDTLVGTDGNDLFNAPAGTLQTGDTLVGGAGEDTLSATLVSGVTVQPNLDSIEVVSLTTAASGGGVNLATSTGVRDINVTGTGAATVTNAAKASLQNIGLTNFNAAAAVSVSNFDGTTALGTAETLNVAVEGTGTSASLALTAAAGSGNLENLNLSSNGAAANTLGLSGALVGTTTTVTGTAALEIRAAAELVNGVTLNGTGLTGDLTLNVNVDTDGTATGTAVNAANFTGVDAFVIRDTDATTIDNASLFNVANDTSIRLASDLGAVTVTVLGSVANTTDSLNITLQNNATVAADVDITSLTAANVETINITSAGAPTTGAVADQQNSIGTLNAAALTSL